MVSSNPESTANFQFQLNILHVRSHLLNESLSLHVEGVRILI
jgi:hypothetical protein